MRLIDLTGQQFGSLTVVQRAPYNDKNNKPIWECRCECGNICYRSGFNLRKHQTNSCGCKERINRKKAVAKRIIDLTGQKFGNLEVIQQAPAKNQKTYWLCKCDCGNEVIIRAQHLIEGSAKSCGCSRKSHGESKIAKILKENNIVFERNYYVNINNNFAFFDFYVDNNYFIEFDGSQHFNFRGSGWNTEDHYTKTVERDNRKNKYCLDNNIPLIRIPYIILDKIELQDLLIDTTNYLINTQQNEIKGENK